MDIGGQPKIGPTWGGARTLVKTIPGTMWTAVWVVWIWISVSTLGTKRSVTLSDHVAHSLPVSEFQTVQPNHPVDNGPRFLQIPYAVTLQPEETLTKVMPGLLQCVLRRGRLVFGNSFRSKNILEASADIIVRCCWAYRIWIARVGCWQHTKETFLNQKFSLWDCCRSQ